MMFLSLTPLIQVTSGSILAWSDDVFRVGMTSSRLALLPPEPRTMLRNDVFSSLSRVTACASLDGLLNWGSLTLSKVSLAGSSLNAAAICVHSALYRASTLSWSVVIVLIHCHES